MREQSGETLNGIPFSKAKIFFLLLLLFLVRDITMYVWKKLRVSPFVVNTNQYNREALLLSQTISGKWNGWRFSTRLRWR